VKKVHELSSARNACAAVASGDVRLQGSLAIRPVVRYSYVIMGRPVWSVMPTGVAMRFQCDHCRAILQIDDTSCGDRIRCAYCHSRVDVPTAYLKPRTVVGEYVVGSHLIDGTRSSLFRAQSLVSGGGVVVKVLNAECMQERHDVAQFLCDAEAGMQFHHPNIVRVHAVERVGSPIYSVMEFVHGVTLAEILNDTYRLPLEPGLRMCRQIAAALNFATKEHRLCRFDLQPDKVFFTGDGVVKIALSMKPGYGLELDNASASGRDITGVHERSLLGVMRNVRSDISRLGRLMFHTLTGRPPVRAATTNEHPLRPQFWQSPQEENPEIPTEVAEMILKMLQPEGTSDSFADFEALISRIDDLGTVTADTATDPVDG
jgi:serine/threonine protein kinase